MRISALLLTAIAACAAEEPSAVEILKASVAHDRVQDARNLKYTWREDEIRTDEKKTFDVIMLEGDNYRKLILVNDKPLDPKLQKKVDQDLEKTRAARRRGGIFHKEIASGGLQDIINACDLTIAGTEIINGHKAWRIEAQPKQSLKPGNKDTEGLLGAHHTLWIDLEDHALVRQTDRFFKPVNGLQPGSQTELTLDKVGDDWMASRMTFHFDWKVAPFVHPKGDVEYRYYDYKLFHVDSTFRTDPPDR